MNTTLNFGTHMHAVLRPNSPFILTCRTLLACSWRLLAAPLRIAQQWVLQSLPIANASPHPMWVRNGLKQMRHVNDRIEKQLAELRLMGHFFTLMAPRLEAHLAVAQALAGRSGIGSAAGSGGTDGV